MDSTETELSKMFDAFSAEFNSFIEKPRCNGKDGDFRLAAMMKIKTLQEQLTTTQQALDAKQEDLNFIWKWIERASWDKHTSPEAAINIIKHYGHAPWYKDREKWDTTHKEYDAEITAFISDRKKLDSAVEALKAGKDAIELFILEKTAQDDVEAMAELFELLKTSGKKVHELVAEWYNKIEAAIAAIKGQVMPVVTEKYYRYRKVYPPHIVRNSLFYDIRETDEEFMRRNLPENCNGLDFYFSHYDAATGNTTYEYFEDEGDMMRNIAVVHGDETIYTQWLKDRKTNKELHDFKMSRK